jgi:outer membrane protein assembly factor BamB
MTLNLRNFFNLFIISLFLSSCANEEKVAGTRIDILEHLQSSEENQTSIIMPKMIMNANQGSKQKNQGESFNYFLNKSLKKSWSLNVNDGPLLTSPLIYENKMILLGETGDLKCLDLISKKILWVYSIVPDPESEKIIGGGLANDNAGNLYVTTSAGELLSISIKFGTLNWRYKVTAPLMDAAAAIDNNIFFRDSANILRSVSINGQLNWFIKGIPQDEIRAKTGRPIPAGKLLLFPNSSGVLSALDIESGVKQWDFRFKFSKTGYSRNVFGSFNGDPLVHDGTIYFGSVNGQFNALELTGDVVWEMPIGLQGSPLLVSNSLFFVSDTNRLVRLNKSNGSLIWSKRLSKKNELNKFFGPVLLGSRIWISSSKGKLISFDAATGKEVAQINISTSLAGLPIYHSGTVILYTKSGELIAFQ